MLAEIEVTEPFAVNGAIVKKLTVSPISFVGAAECAKDARLRSGKSVEYRTAMMRARRKRQIKAYDASGKEIPLDDTAFGQMPRRLFVSCTVAIGSQDDAAGKVLVEGDGIGSPILIELGKPLSFKGDAGATSIRELEFQAKTGGEIENVLSAESPVDQALALIRDCAVPVGPDITLQRLPSWMIEEISISDGNMILDEVLPRFFE